MLALPVRPSVSLIPSLSRSLYMARSREQWPEALKTPGQKYWHPLFTLRLNTNQPVFEQAKKTKKSTEKFQQNVTSSLKSLFI